MTRRAAFTQADIARALRGVAAAGVTPARLEVDPLGRIVVTFGPAAAETPATGDAPEASEEETQWAMSRAAARAAAEKAAKRRASVSSSASEKEPPSTSTSEKEAGAKVH